MMKWAIELAGAGAGGYLGGLLAAKVLLKSDANPNGFVEMKDGFGLDDVVTWLSIAAGSMVGLKLAGKIGPK